MKLPRSHLCRGMYFNPAFYNAETMDDDVKASMHKHRHTTLERMEKYISENNFQDVNLRGKLYPFSKEIDRKYIRYVIGIMF